MTQTLQQGPPVVFECFQAYQRTAALKAGLELDLFTAIGEGHNTPAKMATRCKAAERGVRILADSLTIFGLLRKKDGVYSLTEEAAMQLDARSPAYMGKAVDFLMNPELHDAFKHLTEAVRKGGTAMPQNGTVAAEHPAWISFAKSMQSMQILPAKGVAEMISPLPDGAKVLDIAASHGEFGMAVARRNPKCRFVALDWANVLPLTRQHVQEAGLADRFDTIAGSAFEVDLGSGYDVVLVPNFLHHFDVSTCVSFLKKVQAALKPGGRVVIVEFVPAEDRVTPPPAAAFSLTMLATTPQGDAYTGNQLQGMLKDAGFKLAALHTMPPSPQTVLIAEH